MENYKEHGWRKHVAVSLAGGAVAATIVYALLALWALIVFPGCTDPDTYGPETQNAATLAPQSCPTSIEITNVTWTSFCVGDQRFKTLTVVFEPDGALPNGVDDLSGELYIKYLTCGGTGCGNYYDFTFTDNFDGSFTGVVDNIAQCGTNPIYPSWFTLWVRSHCGNVEAAASLECPYPIYWTCGGGHGDPGEEGVEPDDSTATRYNVHRLTCPAHDNPNAACVCDAAATAQEWSDWLLQWGFLP